MRRTRRLAGKLTSGLEHRGTALHTAASPSRWCVWGLCRCPRGGDQDVHLRKAAGGWSSSRCYGGQPSPEGEWLANRSSPSRSASHAQVSEGWCGRGDSNPHALAGASPSRDRAGARDRDGFLGNSAVASLAAAPRRSQECPNVLGFSFPCPTESHRFSHRSQRPSSPARRWRCRGAAPVLFPDERPRFAVMSRTVGGPPAIPTRGLLSTEALGYSVRPSTSFSSSVCAFASCCPRSAISFRSTSRRVSCSSSCRA